MSELEKKGNESTVKGKRADEKKKKTIFGIAGALIVIVIIGVALIINGSGELNKDAVMKQIEKHEMGDSETKNPYSELGVEDYLYSEKEMGDKDGEAQYSLEYYAFEDEKTAMTFYDDINLMIKTMSGLEKPEVVEESGGEMTIVERDDIYAINIIAEDKLVTLMGLSKDKEELRSIADELI